MSRRVRKNLIFDGACLLLAAVLLIVDLKDLKEERK